MRINYSTDLTSSLYGDSLTIRQEVFIKEQGVPFSQEIESEEGCTYFVIYDRVFPCGTARTFPLTSSTLKLQRFAVLKAYRKQGVGQRLIKAILKNATKNGYQELVLDAQTHAIGFYKKFGFEVISEEFLDAGILHRRMRCVLSALPSTSND